jgi:hypothetical protein
MPYDIAQFQGGDDPQLPIIRRDISGGMNNRQHGTIIKENQVESLVNGSIDIPGQSEKRLGADLVKDLGDNEAGVALFGYEPSGGTNLLVAVHGNELETSSDLDTFTTQKNDFTPGATRIYRVGESGEGDVFVVKMAANNWFRFEPDTLGTQQDLGDTNTSPPLSDVACYFRNRWWILKSNLLYFSDAFPADYSAAFNRTFNAYNIPSGLEQALVPLRDVGIVCLGRDEIWGINPSTTPSHLDKPEKILDMGCVEGQTAAQVGDDVLFLAPDGVRGVFRTQQDKLQLGQSFPLSYPIKTEFESINWGQISKARAVWFDNKYFLALPVDESTINNEVWVYYPSTNSWSVIEMTWTVRTGTVTTSGSSTTVTGSGSLFTTEYKVGDLISFGSGGTSQRRITTVTNNTTIVVDTAIDIDSASTHYHGVGWNVADWAKLTISGEERLYYIDGYEDVIYRAWVTGVNTDDNNAGTARNITYTEIGRKEDLKQPLKKKVGGEIWVRCRSTGGTLTVQVSFDDGGFNTLGTMSLAGNLIDLSGAVTFPITFKSPNVSYDKFPIDGYGSWYYCQIKLIHSGSNNIKVLERDILSRLEEVWADDSA